jgi:hypothetical protein
MPYYLVRHKVQDYAKWKPIFDQHCATRQVYGHRGKPRHDLLDTYLLDLLD